MDIPYARLAQAQSQSGAALIMAIVILAGLLMLGLPFLFSQSASLSGTRSFAHSQTALVGRTTAEDMGIGAAAMSLTRVLPQGNTAEMSTMLDIPYAVLQPNDPRRFTIDLSSEGHQWNPSNPRNTAIIGLSIEDESGKLNPNSMSVKAWERLLARCGIADWDDGQGTGKDDDNIGQLAFALSSARFDRNICPEGHITRFEQLLEVIPQPPGVRWPLTRAELVQIRPYLTLASLGLGREGLIDLGTWIAARGGQLDTVHPSSLLAFPTCRELFAAGSVLAVDPNSQANTQQFPNKYWVGMSTSMDLNIMKIRNWNPAPPRITNNSIVPIAIIAPPPVNLHETSEPVRFALWNISQTSGRQPDQFAKMQQARSRGSKDQLNRDITGFLLQNPLGPYDAPNQSTITTAASRNDAAVQESRQGDPGVSDDDVQPGILAAGARLIWLNLNGGMTWNKIPERGYARIEPANTQTNTNNGDADGAMIPQSTDFEIIYYNGKSRTNGTHLYGVRRGLAFPETTGALEWPAGSRILFIAPSELPPLTIASQGIYTIESGATTADAAGRQNAQQFRRATVQAVPQEELLEMRWEKQSHYHALLVQRHGSLMNAFPKGYQRLQEQEQPDGGPDNNALPIDMNELDHNVGVRPGVLRTMLSATHLGRRGREWSRSFSNELPNDDWTAQGNMEYAPTVGGGRNIQDLTPEGLTLRGDPLAYAAFRYSANNAQRGVLSYPDSALTSPPINGRLLGLWLKPNEQLTGNVTIFDVRSPQENAGDRFAEKQPYLPVTGNMEQREAGDNYYQNRVTLQYEAASKQLVLTIASPITEHLYDHGPIVPSETFLPPAGGAIPPPSAGPYIDPRSLGEDDPAGFTAGVNPIGAKRPFNLVQHRYQLDQTDGLRANMWHHIQVGFVADDPGHMSIVVNGIVGRELTKLPAMTNMQQVGDHVTLPSMVLKTALPAASPNANASSLVVIPSIELDAAAIDANSNQIITGAPALAMLLPKRGMIRVGNEYISYDDIQGTTLINCLRARRQDSIIGLNGTNDIYPQLEAHLTGSLVVPGGLHYNPGNRGHLWRGGCTLAEELPNGDPMTNFRVWTELTTPMDIDMVTGRPVLLSTVTIINVQNGVIDQWPTRGYAEITRTGEIVYYDNAGAKPTTQLLNVQRGQFGTAPQDLVWPIDPSMTEDYDIRLISFEVNGDPTGNYAAPDPQNPQVETRLLQIMDNTTGRIEWISYSNIDSSKGPFFFWARNMYYFDPLRRRDGRRARQRTAFAGTDLTAAPTFPALSRVIPVQTSFPHGHLLATGDVLTILPKTPGGAANGRPYQVCVRYSATDGIPTTPGEVPPDGNTWDTYNGYFAFTEALPENWPDGSFEILAWPGWSGNDLTLSSRAGNATLLANTMPLAAAFSPGYALGGNVDVYFCGDDTTKPFLQGGTTSQPFNGVIDAMYAGDQPGGYSRRSNTIDNLIYALGTANSNNVTPFLSDEMWLAASASIGNVIVQATNDIFTRDLGIVLIGGEAFAYERQRNANGSISRRRIKLIGRGLLGSEPADHFGPEPAIVLPIGPVGRLVTPLTNRQQEVQISERYDKRYVQDEIDAPALMLCSPDGKQMEIFAMPDRWTAPWLRGMYNTMVQGNWGPQQGQDTLVIGWWPRYPSGHPNRASQAWGNNDQSNALIRNRMYAWMSYPIRFHDTWLTGGNALVDLTLLSDGDGTYNVSASALPDGFDWNAVQSTAMQLTPGGSSTDASSIFANFAQRAVDGVEVRVRFEYAQPPANAAQGTARFLHQVAVNGNTAPMLGKAYLRARAPSKVLQVEEAR